MQQDGLSLGELPTCALSLRPVANDSDSVTPADTARLAISSETDEDANIKIAAARLAQEARQLASYGKRGVTDVTEQFTAASKGLCHPSTHFLTSNANTISRAAARRSGYR
jgi:hypothetical protein